MAPKEVSSKGLLVRREGVVRTTRMLEGKVELIGVAGRTLRDVCGLRP